MTNGFLVGMWHYIVPPDGLSVKVTGEMTSLENFRNQMEMIKEKFHVISADTALRAVYGKEELPQNSLLLTFDDGVKNQMDVALPVLQEFGFPALFFVMTAPLTGKIPGTFKLQLICGETDRKTLRYEIFPQVLRRNNLEKYLEGISFGAYTEPKEIGEVKWTCNYVMARQEKDVVINEMFNRVFGGKETILTEKMFMTKSDIISLQRLGMAIGSHGINHNNMSTLEESELETELSGSKLLLEKILGFKVTCLGYPGCLPPKDIDKVRKTGYLAAFACLINPPVNQPPYETFALRRMHDRDLEKSFLA